MLVDDVILFLDYGGNFSSSFSSDGQRPYVRYGARPVRHHDQVCCFCSRAVLQYC